MVLKPERKWSFVRTGSRWGEYSTVSSRIRL